MPQIVRPIAFDQFDNANSLQKLGVAECVLARAFTTQTVVAIARKLLTSAGVKATLKVLSDKVTKGPSINHVATYITNKIQQH